VAQACRVLAVFELGRRFYGSQSVRIGAAGDVYPLVRHYASLKQEQFLCLSLNGAHEVLAIRVVTIGLLNRTMVHPREVFADPLADRAAAIIICHNHPSGCSSLRRRIEASLDESMRRVPFSAFPCSTT
jgi:DNA repair protein RadC